MYGLIIGTGQLLYGLYFKLIATPSHCHEGYSYLKPVSYWDIYLIVCVLVNNPSFGLL